MTYEIEVTAEAESYLKRLDKPTRQRISNRIDQLAEDPLGHSKSLTAAGGVRSSRVGGYRILFEIHEGRLVVLILAVGSRGQIYRRL